MVVEKIMGEFRLTMVQLITATHNSLCLEAFQCSSVVVNP